jgi:uncharacterized protein (DUF1501 family)
MRRRDFLGACAAAGLLGLLPAMARAGVSSPYRRLLVLVELKGGNDGLNTVVPYADPNYYALRPRLAIRAEDVLPLDAGHGLHPALQPLLPLWQGGELAIIQGLGYPQPNLSHFRSIEIWDTASASNQTLQQGWLARSFRTRPPPAAFAADALVVGSQDMGPFVGGGRVVALSNPEQFARQARLAQEGGSRSGGALAHILRVESDIVAAAAKFAAPTGGLAMRSEFPQTGFGNAVRTACQVLGSGAEVAVLRLSLSGFDTHQNQPGVHANLLRQLGRGPCRLAHGAHRTQTLGAHAGVELRRVRPASQGEPEQWHRPRHQQRPFRPRRCRARRLPWRTAEPRAPRRRRQPGIHRRLPPPVCDGAGALVGNRIRICAGGAFSAPGIRRMTTYSNPKEKPE